MLIVRIMYNLIVLAIEVALVVAVAWAGFRYPLPFAAGTAALACLMGIVLERARLNFELPFYFGTTRTALSIIGTSAALVEGLLKALLAGIVAILTFSGTDQGRLTSVAIIFGACVFAGSSILRRLSISLGAIPARWGYFRLAAPLGLIYSAAIAVFLPPPSLGDVGRKLFLDLPARPNLAQASEALFVLKQKFDDIIVTLASQFVSPLAAKAIGVLVSVNMLTGFVIGVFAVAISEVVRRMEEAGP